MTAAGVILICDCGLSEISWLEGIFDFFLRCFGRKSLNVKARVFKIPQVATCPLLSRPPSLTGGSQRPADQTLRIDAATSEGLRGLLAGMPFVGGTATGGVLALAPARWQGGGAVVQSARMVDRAPTGGSGQQVAFAPPLVSVQRDGSVAGGRLGGGGQEPAL